MIGFLGRTAEKLFPNRSKSSNEQRPRQVTLEDYSKNNRKLPPNFADDLLNLEIELEQGRYTISNINRVLELYSAAIEYYESIVSNKHLIFQNKLKTLMGNQNVIDALNDEFRKNNNGREPRDPIYLTQKQKAEKFQQEFMKNASQDIQVNRFRESLHYKIAAVEGIVKEQVCTQEDAIMKRLEERKNKFSRTKSQQPAPRAMQNDEKTPDFSKKKEEADRIKKSKEELAKLKKTLGKEEEKKGENQNGAQDQKKAFLNFNLKVEENPQERKLSRMNKGDDIAFKIMNFGPGNLKQSPKPTEKISSPTLQPTEQERNLLGKRDEKELFLTPKKDENPERKEEKAPTPVKDSNAFRVIKKK